MKTMTLTESFTRARTAFRIGEYELVEKLMNSVIEQKPDLPEAHNFLGNLYSRMGDFDRAIKNFEKAIDVKKDYAEAYNNLGVAKKNIERFNDAVSILKKASKLLPDRPDIYYNLGNVYKKMGKRDKAIEAFLKAQEIDPEFAPTYNNLGRIYEEQNQYDKTISQYKKGLQVDFNQPKIHYNLGIALEKTGNFKEAQEALEQALKVKPGWVDALNNLGVVLQKQDKQKEAARAFEEILKIDSDNLQARNNLGVIYGNLGRNEEAVQYYREALKLDPGYFKAVSNLGLVFEQNGQYSEALEEFEKLVNLEPENLDARFRLGNIYMYLERFDEAAVEFNRILEVNPNHKESLHTLGRIYQKSGREKEARSFYKKLMKLDPENKEVHLDLAVILKEKGDFKAAEKELKKFLKEKPDDEGARLLLGQVYESGNLYKHAAQVFKDILETNSDNREAHEYLARIYRKMGQPEDALGALENAMTLEGTRASTEDIDKLRDTLDIYEQTIAEYAPDYRDEWDRNIKLLKKLGSEALDTVEEDTEQFDVDSLIVDEMQKFEEDAVPIINIGGMEPVLAIEEEEEELRLEEEEEEGLVEEAIEIKDESPPSLMNLLSDQDLYEENPDWKSFKLPPSLEESPKKKEASEAQAPDKEKKAEPSADISQGALTPEGEGVIAESLKESVKAQQDLVAGLAEDLKDISRRLGSRSQFMPVPIPTPMPSPPIYYPQVPSAPPQGLSEQAYQPFPDIEGEGIPRFAQDAAVEEEPFDIFIPEGLTEQDKMPPELDGEPEAELEEVDEEEELQKKEERNGDIRKELKDYLNGVRQKLDEKSSEEELPELPEAVEDATPGKLFNYLQELTDYLPEDEKSSFLHSDARLKMEFLKSRLGGRGGIRKQIEEQYKPAPKPPIKEITPEKIADTFAYMKDLASFHPDRNIGDMMQSKIDGILRKIRR